MIVIAVTVLSYLLDNQISGSLIYQRDMINQGQWWRIISAAFFHTNIFHLILNVTAVLLLWVLHGNFYNTQSYLLTFFFCAFMSSIGIHFFSYDVKQYLGLSGALHGVFFWGAIQEIKHEQKIGYLLAAGIVLKLLYEQLFGASFDTIELIDADVAIDAHLWGVLGGAIASLPLMSAKRRLQV
jgi:rhomboid family GlyGly-CTERM serine protease|tara:strand:- start:1581 stop:2129 length:549 start_codon:yes stop_codon:yes gene_type:complete